MIKDIRKEKENTNEIYNVSEGSREAADLEILRKGRDSMGNPQAVLTEDEMQGIRNSMLTDSRTITAECCS